MFYVVILIPSLKLHEKWETRLLGKSFIEIDRFIDNPYKEIDTHLLRNILAERGKKEEFDYYFDFMVGNDAWKHCNDVFFLYIYGKYGMDGLEAAFLHVFLDLFVANITDVASADLTTFREIIDKYVRRAEKSFLSDLPESLNRLRKISELVKANLSDILSDVLEWRKSIGKIGGIGDIACIEVYHEPYVLARDEKELIEALKETWYKSFRTIGFVYPEDLSYHRECIREFLIARNMLDKLSQMDVSVVYFDVTRMELNMLEKIQSRIREIALSTKISTKCSERHAFFEISGETATIVGGYMIIVRYRDGSEVFYPHSIWREEHRIEVKPLDFLISLLETSLA